MSTEKYRAEALRWFQTAESDLDAARILRPSGKFAHACFHAQQARFYIPTRYPNGLPDITPEAAFFAEDAESAIRKAERLLETVRPLLS